MGTKTTFHNHEVVGANKVYKWMDQLGFARQDSIRVSKLIRHHQFRFYDDTARTTIRKWLEDLGKQGFEDIISVRLADRAGNLKNKDKPLYTKELNSLIETVKEMVAKREVVFLEDLAIGYKDLNRMNVNKSQQKEAVANMLGIVRADASRNTVDYLVQYIKRNYLKDKA